MEDDPTKLISNQTRTLNFTNSIKKELYLALIYINLNDSINKGYFFSEQLNIAEKNKKNSRAININIGSSKISERYRYDHISDYFDLLQKFPSRFCKRSNTQKSLTLLVGKSEKSPR